MTLRFLLAAIAVSCSCAHAEKTSLEDAVRGALERDPAFTMERLSAQRNLYEAQQAERGLRPRLSLTSAGARYYRSEFYERREATATLSLQQSPHPGRTVTVSLRDTSWWVEDRDDDKKMWSHDPTVSVGLRQSLPAASLPFNALARAAAAKPAAAREKAAAFLEQARNTAVLRTARLYFRVVEWRRLVGIRAAALEQRKAEARNSERAASLRLGGRLEAERESLLIQEEELALASERSALARSEADLEAAVGAAGLDLSPEIPEVALDLAEAALREKAMTSNAALRSAGADLRTRQADAALSALAESPVLSASVSVDGEYYTTDTINRGYDESVASLRPRLIVSVLVDLPVLRRRDRELAREAALADQARAAVERARREDGAAADVADLWAERERRVRMIGLRERQVALAAQELRVRADLAAVQQAAPAEVAHLRAAQEERETALWRSRADLFLLDLELASVAGYDLGRMLLTTSR